jgi:hypothetical protein
VADDFGDVAFDDIQGADSGDGVAGEQDVAARRSNVSVLPGAAT